MKIRKVSNLKPICWNPSVLWLPVRSAVGSRNGCKFWRSAKPPKTSIYWIDFYHFFGEFCKETSSENQATLSSIREILFYAYNITKHHQIWVNHLWKVSLMIGRKGWPSWFYLLLQSTRFVMVLVVARTRYKTFSLFNKTI